MNRKSTWKERLVMIMPFLLVIFILFCFPTACAHGHEHSHGHGHTHDHGHAHDEKPSFKWSKEANEAYNEEKEHLPPLSSSKWAEAIGATLLISIAPYLILFFIPVTNTQEHAPYLKVLLAFASGGLLGDAFLHLIPHAMMASTEGSGSHSHSHSHSHGDSHEGGHSHDISVGVSVLGGMLAFLIVEKFVRIFKGGHSHSHGPAAPPPEKKKGKQSKVVKKESGGSMKVAGYLNLAADFTHNLTDGLAIGASFMAGRSIGLITTFTIFLHEIPHEIGDFAILLQSGCTRKKAMMLQLVTALGAVTGTIMALMAEGADGSYQSWILPFTAGGFIYIATVSVIPELLENSSFWQSVWEVAAILLGVGLMVIITWIEAYDI